MSTTEVRSTLEDRIAAAALSFTPDVVDACCAYMELLRRWNKTINLTALRLAGEGLPASIDKLVIEPLIAAQLLTEVGSDDWFDLGSGGGSPAIPLRVVRRRGRMTMVESRERKCSFLREVVRTLGLGSTSVLNTRFEQLPLVSQADLITVRAVRFDQPFTDVVAGLSGEPAYLLSFGSAPADSRFQQMGSTPLPDGSLAGLYRLSDVPRETQSRTGI